MCYPSWSRRVVIFVYHYGSVIQAYSPYCYTLEYDVNISIIIVVILVLGLATCGR